MPRSKTYKITKVTIVLLIVFSFIAGSFGGVFINQILEQFRYVEKGPIISQKETVREVATETYVEESGIIDTVEKVSPAVVSVVVKKNLTLYKQNYYFDPFEEFFQNDDFFGMPRFEIETPNQNRENENNETQTPTEKQKVGAGSGFIFSADGLILTNKHVVEDKNAEYTVILNNGTEYDAKVLGLDPLNDLAVLKIEAKNLPYLNFGDSDSLKVGQRVVAIGNALAEYENTVTTGVISAKGRNIIAGGSIQGTEALSNLLQTDAAINPGNSGGPLCNLKGEVIGINTAIATNANGIGFAIPINDVKQVVESVKKYGKIVRPMLGIRYVLIDAEHKADLGLDKNFDLDYGALISGDPNSKKYAVVPGSPAEKAGLMKDDIILEVNGTKVDTPEVLKDIATKYQIGDILNLKIWRDGKSFEVKVALQEIDIAKEAPAVREQ